MIHAGRTATAVNEPNGLQLGRRLIVYHQPLAVPAMETRCMMSQHGLAPNSLSLTKQAHLRRNRRQGASDTAGNTSRPLDLVGFLGSLRRAPS